MKTIYGHTRGYCPVHEWTDFQIFAIDDDKETVKACAKCIKEAEEFLLDDAS